MTCSSCNILCCGFGLLIDRHHPRKFMRRNNFFNHHRKLANVFLLPRMKRRFLIDHVSTHAQIKIIIPQRRGLQLQIRMFVFAQYFTSCSTPPLAVKKRPPQMPRKRFKNRSDTKASPKNSKTEGTLIAVIQSPPGRPTGETRERLHLTNKTSARSFSKRASNILPFVPSSLSNSPT